MSTTSLGREAESLVAERLKAEGYQILSQNWRTRYCEIDIVAKKDKTIYFIEVKYRNNNSWGGGLEAITPSKLKQMHFAAEFWVADESWAGDYSLMAAAVSGDPPEINDIIDL